MEKTCETPGCFETSYDSKLCGKCLGGDLPLKRGPVTNHELMHARRIGSEDARVTLERLVLNKQPETI
jgi:hypothetical protein